MHVAREVSIKNQFAAVRCTGCRFPRDRLRVRRSDRVNTPDDDDSEKEETDGGGEGERKEEKMIPIAYLVRSRHSQAR